MFRILLLAILVFSPACKKADDKPAADLSDPVSAARPVTELGDDQHVVVDTSLPLDENIKSLSTVIPTWPQGLTGP